MIERRTEPRMLCADLVDVRWKDKAGKSKRAVANLEDISASGVCLQMDEQIPLETEVKINYPKGELTGVVRYCIFREIGYFLGLEFPPGHRWTQQDYKPMHMLDPRSLAKNAESDDESPSPKRSVQ